MKGLPSTHGARMRLFCLIGFLLLLVIGLRADRATAYLLSGKQEGDILFQSLPSSPMTTAIEGVTRSEWSHCGILMKLDGQWMVAEALGMVQYTPLRVFILRGRGSKVMAYRVKALPGDYRDRLDRGIEPFLNTLYDARFEPDDSVIYCSELVYKAYDRALGIRLGQWERLGDLNWEPHEAFIRKQEGGDPPLDRWMITPVGLTRSPLVQRVH